MKNRVVKTIVAIALATVMTLPVFGTTVKANDFLTPENLSLGAKISETIEKGDSHWYKLEIPEDIRTQDIEVVYMCGKNVEERYNGIAAQLCDCNGAEIAWIGSTESATNPLSCVLHIKDEPDDEATTLVKGETYLIHLWGGDINHSGKLRDYILKISGDYKKANELFLTAKNGEKSISASTIEGATVTIKCNRAILKNGGKKVRTLTVDAADGEVDVKLSRALKSGDKITVISKKDGHETCKKIKKFY